jgi:hypothetical protein
VSIQIITGLDKAVFGECCACSDPKCISVTKIIFGDTARSQQIRLCNGCKAELLEGLKNDDHSICEGREALGLLMAASKEDLMEIEGIGEDAADSIYEYFHEPSNVAMIEALIAAGVNPML